MKHKTETATETNLKMYQNKENGIELQERVCEL